MVAKQAKDEELLKLYELAVNEHHYYERAHQTRIAFYSGFLSALVVATAVGLVQASEWYHFVFLCVGPALIIAISPTAIEGTFRFYQRLIESITVRAKIEQELGLTSSRRGAGDLCDPYWQSEPLIPPRHLRDRRTHESSEDFIRERVTMGYQRVATKLFRGFQWVSAAMLLFLICVAGLKALGCLLKALGCLQ